MTLALFSVQDPGGGGNGLVSEGLLQSVALAERTVHLQLTDTVDLFGLPCIRMAGDIRGRGSDALRVRRAGLGWNLSMSATAAEDTELSASSVENEYDDVTVARRGLRLDETQLAEIAGGEYGFDPIDLGMTLADSFRAGRMDALATAVMGATVDVTAADQGDIDDVFDILDVFSGRGYTGPLYGYIHPTTMGSIRDSVRAEVGPLKEREDIQALRAVGAEPLLGIGFFLDNRVVADGGNYHNAVMAVNAMEYAIGTPEPKMAANQQVRPAGQACIIDFKWEPETSKTLIIANGYDGIAIGEDNRSVGLVCSTT